MSAGPEVISLGCRLNIAESERIRAMLVGEHDVVVVNSCAVTAEAVRTTRQAIRKARREQPDARLLVTGCAAEVEREQLAAMPEIDGLIANARKLDPRLYNVSPREGGDLRQTCTPSDDLRPLPSQGLVPVGHTRAFVAVQNGCDHSCTFCVIPQGRGPSRSLTIPQVLTEIEGHLVQGAPEVVLTGVDVTSWGHDLPDRPPLGRLVQAILETFPELRRLRMSSLDGIEIDPLLLDLFAGDARLMPHLHLSLQHGNDLILKRMKRRHLRADVVELVARFKQARPEIAIGADLIAGFPTEDGAAHADNLSIVRELGIVHGHVFPYSPRPGTPAARMPQVERTAIKARAAELRAEVVRTRDAWLDTLVGAPQSVLAENDGTGYAPHFARVVVPEGIASGAVVTVTPQRHEKGLLS